MENQDLSSSQLAIQYGSLTEDNFLEFPVWFEYDVPEQLDYLVSIGVSRDWLLRKIVAVTDRSNRSVWFAKDALSEMPATSVLAVSARIWLGSSSAQNGYLTVVEQGVASCTLLDGNVVLSLADVLDEDNRDSLREIALRSSRHFQDLFPIHYEVSTKVTGVSRANALHIPVAT